MILIICASSLTLMGLIMFIFPQKSVKAEFRNNEEQIKKTRKYGLIITIIGIIMLLLTIF